MGLQPDEPVDDVHAGLLELARPDDVGLLVEPRLDLDEREHLLARLGGVDQRLDDRAVARGAVQRLLDGEHVGVGGRLLEERLHARRERLVRVVHAARRAWRIAAKMSARPFGSARLQLHAPSSARASGSAARAGRSWRGRTARRGRAAPGRRYTSCSVMSSSLHQQAEGHVVHVVGDLETDRRAEPAAQQLLLERLDEVLGLVLLDLDVLVAGDAERVVLEDLHAGEEVAEVVGDEVLER